MESGAPVVQPTDVDFLQLFRNGMVEDGWDLFLERYGTALLAIARCIAKDEDDASDCFVAVLDKLRQRDCAHFLEFDPQRGSFAGWLTGVVKYALSDLRRQRYGRRRVRPLRGASLLGAAIWQQMMVNGGGPSATHSRLVITEQWCDLTFPDLLREWRVVHRLALDQKRSAVFSHNAPGAKGREQPLEDEESTGEISDLAQGLPLSTGDAMAVGNVVLSELLLDLPIQYRQTLVCTYFEGFSAAEVAAHLGWKNERVVWNRVSRALALLRTKCAERGLALDDFVG